MNFFNKRAPFILGSILLLLIIITFFQSQAGKVDDWQYEHKSNRYDSITQSAQPKTKNFAVKDSANIGLSTGGAKDVNNFRKNIENDYLPLLSDITYEGLFYDYYFDTGEKEECNELFCPSYTYAVSKDPFSKKENYYMSVGLNSGMKKEEFTRKKLNLIVVLDISGSMGSPFNKYHYDKRGQIKDTKDEDAGKSKIEIASKSVLGLMGHLKENDRFGMVLFDNKGYLAKPLRKVGQTDMDAVQNHILELKSRGGTNFEAGYKTATEAFDEVIDAAPEEYENRIIFLTDAMPNTGSTSKQSLLGMTKNNAKNNIYTTFIGIGVDFNSKLIEHITKIKGANYYSVHSSREFKTRMDDEFEYMVTPLVFDLELKLDAKGYEVQKVYGSPEANEATGEVMKVNTLFPSSTSGNKTKGGIVLLKLKKTSKDTNLKLTASYENRTGIKHNNSKSISLKNKDANYYANTGIRKGILLSRYADLLKNWITDERRSHSDQQMKNVSVIQDEGIIVPPDIEKGKWERQSIPLKVNQQYKKLFSEFINYFKDEMKAVEDKTLSKELDVLKKLSKYNN